MDQINLIAQTNLGCIKGLGPLGETICEESQQGSAGPAPLLFTTIITLSIGIMTIVSFVWFLYQVFLGTISWIGAGGDKAKLQEAQKKITNGIVGVVLVISAIFIVKLIGTIFGVDFLDVTRLISNLW
jgi:hypothetical protein